MNRQDILQYVDKKFKKKDHKPFRVGDTVRVHVKIMEAEASRIQVFEGTVIAMKGHGGARMFTVRKISFGVGVERCFPLTSPAVERVEVMRSGHSRRAKHYYLRTRLGKAARLEEKEGLETAGKKSSPEQKASTSQTPPQELVSAEEK